MKMCISVSPFNLTHETHSHSIPLKPTVLAVLTNEPCVGGQAGLVIVLVGTGARCVRSLAAVHHVVSQPRPADQT